ncbi:catechol 1,2-dioxygenase-like [Branchiostoma floridae]|uniref:Catechol 1,2-dioxygenase-like n=1 Tax=Branchiostoma floridae TaxID=7739 RepID=A0A9J7L1B3_BRAFL|nr:catechol 1,2-dioxygenase-like [Branchiostoma floridae]
MSARLFSLLFLVGTSCAQFVPGTDTGNGLQNGCSVTPADTLGPYYVPNSPVSRTMCLGTSDDDYMFVKGTVYDVNCHPVHGANVEVWQADKTGLYYDDRCRVQFTADQQGKYSFVTTVPGKYLLGYYYRPAHIHYRVTAPGYREIITQLYFSHDDSLGANDPCGSACNSGSAELIMDIRAPTADDLVQIAQLVTFPISKVVEFNPVMSH